MIQSEEIHDALMIFTLLSFFKHTLKSAATCLSGHHEWNCLIQPWWTREGGFAARRRLSDSLDGLENCGVTIQETARFNHSALKTQVLQPNKGKIEFNHVWKWITSSDRAQVQWSQSDLGDVAALNQTSGSMVDPRIGSINQQHGTQTNEWTNEQTNEQTNQRKN